eukprot:TRINITY_DN123030_c0_g1_i1.p1 TRINITY_DN123030_c0_g1~~TRINITY_DN123030_c0_g1_i1.p1  ORF type:complete len:242 (-),score=50.29 TRINITY_DN123030_c0_g1_i1:124-849(-)
MPPMHEDELLLGHATGAGHGYPRGADAHGLPPSMCANVVWYSGAPQNHGGLVVPIQTVEEPCYADAFDHARCSPANLPHTLVQLLPQRRPHHWLEEDAEALTPRGRSTNTDKCDLALSPIFKRLRIDDGGMSSFTAAEKASIVRRAPGTEAMEIEEAVASQEALASPQDVAADMATEPCEVQQQAEGSGVVASCPSSSLSVSRSVPLDVWKAELQRRAREERRRYMQDLRTCEMGMVRRAC